MKLLVGILALLIMLQGCGSATRVAINKGDYATAEAEFKKEGLEGKVLYEAMAKECLSSKRYLKAAEYFIKSGMVKQKAFDKVAIKKVWRGEVAVWRYQKYSSHKNYLSLIKRVGLSRNHESSKVRKYAEEAFKVYENGAWPKKAHEVYNIYVKAVDEKVKYESSKLQMQARKS